MILMVFALDYIPIAGGGSDRLRGSIRIIRGLAYIAPDKLALIGGT